MKSKKGWKIIFTFCVSLNIIILLPVYSQNEDSLKGRNIYKPVNIHPKDSIIVKPADLEMQKADSIRQQIVKDSLLAREKFIQDSILHRQHILDSLNTLIINFERILEAYFKTTTHDLIIRSRKIPIVGDSVLGNYEYLRLPLGVTDPYTPWKGSAYLTGNKFRVSYEGKTGTVKSVQSSQIRASFDYQPHLLIIHIQPGIQKNSAGTFYKVPLDSVFYDNNNRIARIKSYVLFYSLTANNQKGQFLFLNRNVVKQYSYDPSGEILQLQIVKFCERMRATESNKVCSILTYSFTNKGGALLVNRKNDPANNYSDGTFTFTLDDKENITGVSFVNIANTENWQRLIELNKDGFVNCYIDKANGIIKQSLCMIYHDKEPGAKYPVETITTIFEKDGISYYQRNNTTDKIRTRDKMTLEWTDWK